MTASNAISSRHDQDENGRMKKRSQHATLREIDFMIDSDFCDRNLHLCRQTRDRNDYYFHSEEKCTTEPLKTRNARTFAYACATRTMRTPTTTTPANVTQDHSVGSPRREDAPGVSHAARNEDQNNQVRTSHNPNQRDNDETPSRDTNPDVSDTQFNPFPLPTVIVEGVDETKDDLEHEWGADDTQNGSTRSHAQSVSAIDRVQELVRNNSEEMRTQLYEALCDEISQSC